MHAVICRHGLCSQSAGMLPMVSTRLLLMRMQEGMLLDEVPGPSTDLMDEDRIGAGSGRPKRRR